MSAAGTGKYKRQGIHKRSRCRDHYIVSRKVGPARSCLCCQVCNLKDLVPVAIMIASDGRLTKAKTKIIKNFERHFYKSFGIFDLWHWNLFTREKNYHLGTIVLHSTLMDGGPHIERPIMMLDLCKSRRLPASRSGYWFNIVFKAFSL